ncbi:hypothetical protein G7Z17_g4178 [Cylindrodendrum hubeiense]|uniref:Protein kinase domain-containing protein n=1 Tax=Cylindrodendrum hubeiense TaxID=595255 RepID=A0A9P5HEH5_9HYPO|nr:hypothetical protein G7Z17_g4178 [Cylindrodendrum hubeiense]
MTQQNERRTINALWEQIQYNRILALDRRYFVPPSSLETIFTPAAITAAIGELHCEVEDRLGLAVDIQSHKLAVTTFAILVWIKCADAVVNFRRHGCLGRLPLGAEFADTVAPGFALAFLQVQWEFLPYILHSGMDTVIPESRILPFVRQLGPPISGGFGTVERLEIQPSLQDFFPHDVNMNLAELFKRPEPYGRFNRISTYVSALHGLASALERAHDVRISDKTEGVEFHGIGYHHDLRPENILVSTGTLWLADFGMGRVRPREDGSTTRIKGVKGDYSAPEAMDENFVTRDVGRAIDLMNLWFERERLRAFGSVLGIFSTTIDRSMAELADQHGKEYLYTVSDILQTLQMYSTPLAHCGNEIPLAFDAFEPNSQKSTAAMHESSASPTFQHGTLATPEETQTSVESAQNLLCSDIQKLVQRLWCLLPEHEVRKAERIWVRSMLGKTNDIDQLTNMEHQLASQESLTYQHGAALLMIKKIRLEMTDNPTNRVELRGLVIPASDIPKPDRSSTKQSYGHRLGTFQGNTRVLIESMFYDPSWEKIPPDERILVMARKAKCFNVQPRPSNLRLLDCLGFFETGSEGSELGYSFVYRAPESTSPSTTSTQQSQQIYTLMSLLPSHDDLRANPHSQPNLGDKFALASSLAGFLVEFHGTGWLHENFHSNNMVYFGSPSRFGKTPATSTNKNTIRKPYINYFAVGMTTTPLG